MKIKPKYHFLFMVSKNFVFMEYENPLNYS